LTYQDIEDSIDSGSPIELYDFEYLGDHWRYTSADEDITYDLNEYTAVPIDRSAFEVSDNIFRNELDITVDRDNLFARKFILASPEEKITLTVYRGHSTFFVKMFVGQVSDFIFNKKDTKIKAAPFTSALARIELRRKFQKMCPYALYEEKCTINKSSWSVSGTILTITGTTITATIFSSKANGWFLNGYIETSDGIRRLITSHSGTTITILNEAEGLSAGKAFTAYAGCLRTVGDCKDKFSNFINYGGQPYIPTINPFGGDGVK